MSPEAALIQSIDVIASRLDQVKTVHAYRDQVEAAARADERKKVLERISAHISSDSYDLHSDSLIELLAAMAGAK